MTDEPEIAAPTRRSRSLEWVVPVGLILLALLVVTGSQMAQLIGDRGSLATVRAGQEQTVQESIRLRQQLESLGGRTAKLAAEGNAAARQIVEDFRRQGVALTVPRQ